MVFPFHTRVPISHADRIGLSFSLLVYLSPASAADVMPLAAPLDPVVVTATGLPQPLSQTLSSTTVITSDDIRASGSVDLPTLLRSAGLDLSQSGGLGTVSSVFLRGAESRQVLVLVDGVRIGSATLGSAPLEQVMLDEVERVEVVRGNVSALYGSGAVGGVIQIFTRRGDGPMRPDAAVEVGSHDMRRLSAGIAGSVGIGAIGGDTRYSLHLSHVRTAGISAIDPALAPAVNPDRDGYRNTSVTASVSQQLTAMHALGASLYVSNGRGDYDNPFGTPTETDVQHSATNTVAGWWQADFSPAWRSTLRVSYAKDKSDTVVNRAAPDTFETYGTEADWKNDVTVAPQQVLTLGASTLEQRVASNTAFDRTQRRTNSAYASFNGRIADRHQLQLAIRHDDLSDVGGATTGLAGYGFDLTPEWRLSATASSAFDAPTFNQLFYPGFSNPLLKPERARSREVAAQYADQTSRWRLTWFRTVYTDLIDSPPPAYLPVNVARAHASGFELSASTRVAGWSLGGNATLQNARRDDSGVLLNRRARRFGSVDTSREWGAWRFGAEVVAVGKRPDGDQVLDRYMLLNLNLAWRFQPGWSVEARVNDVGNSDDRSAYSYNAPRREAFVGVAWRP